MDISSPLQQLSNSPIQTHIHTTFQLLDDLINFLSYSRPRIQEQYQPVGRAATAKKVSVFTRGNYR